KLCLLFEQGLFGLRNQHIAIQKFFNRRQLIYVAYFPHDVVGVESGITGTLVKKAHVPLGIELMSRSARDNDGLVSGPRAIGGRMAKGTVDRNALKPDRFFREPHRQWLAFF